MNTDKRGPRLLAIVDLESIEPGTENESKFLSRAVSLSKQLGGELELFHVCCDRPPDQGLLALGAETEKQKQGSVDEAGARLAECAVAMREQGVKVTSDARWGQSQSEAILAKIADTEPDMVLKSMPDHNYIVGLVSNEDWELLRRSPAPVWFMRDDATAIRKILAAIGSTLSDDEVIADTDHEVLQLTGWLSDSLGAEQIPVHAYEAPKGVTSYADYEPSMGVGNSPGVMPAHENVRAHEAAVKRRAEKHNDIIRDFVRRFDIDAEKLRLAEGAPSDVLPEIAEDVAADLIVMGARRLGRLERAFSSVTAEPALGKASCDMVFVKSSTGSSASEATRQ